MDDIAITDPCIVFALAREARPFLREFRPHTKVADAPCWASFCGPSWLSVLVLQIGIGPERADKAMSWLMQPAKLDSVSLQPKVILSVGFAGATTDEYHVGDIVLADEVVNEAGEVWPTTWPGDLPPGPWQPALHRGRVLTVAKAIGDPNEKRRLGQAHGAIALDMETATVARWCARHEVPFGAVRAISDEAATTLPSRLLSLLGTGRVSPARVLRATITSPSLLPRLFRLARDTRRAATQLSRALGELLTLTTPLGEP
jgi:nucleoside phosphorylase